MRKNILEAKRLCKEYKDVKAVDDLSFSVEQGCIYGFLGQNGAGKSTTIRMLLDLVRPDSGTIEIFGMELRRHRNEIMRKVGAIIERPDLYKYLTGWENLKIFARMSRLRIPSAQLKEQLALVGLLDRAHSKVSTYSQGMKQRLGIAVALVHDPVLVILDEPTNGLDPQGIADMRNLILHLCRDRGKTVIVSSHLLSEIELIADSMLIIDKGRKLVEGKARDLFDPAEAICELTTVDTASTIEKIRDSVLAPFYHGQRKGAILMKLHRDQVPVMNRQLVEMDIPVLSLSSRHSLEDYFLSLTSRTDVPATAN